jgi:peptide deformylase
MTILNILEAPHPTLSAKARDVREDEFGPELVSFLENMAITMYAAPGVGLAAPQVNDSRRILVADPGNNDDGSPRMLYSMVNPTIISKSEDYITYEESCLSVPEFYINVKRYQQITILWKDGVGNVRQQTFEEFPAIVLQHEMDHLEGITLLDRSSRFRRSRYVSKRKKLRR